MLASFWLFALIYGSELLQDSTAAHVNSITFKETDLKTPRKDATLKPRSTKEIWLSDLLNELGNFPSPLADSLTVELLSLTLTNPPMKMPEKGLKLVFDHNTGGLAGVKTGTVETKPGRLFKSICRLIGEITGGKAPPDCEDEWSARAVRDWRLDLIEKGESIKKEHLDMMWKWMIKAYRDPDEKTYELFYKRDYRKILRRMDSTIPLVTEGEMLGKGALGEVWKTKLGDEICAVKIIDLEKIKRNLALITQELDALQDVKGLPNVIQLKRAQMHGPSHVALVTELYDGIEGTHIVFHLSGDSGFRILAYIFKQVIIGLQGIHGRGRIHSDMKWQNIRLGLDGRVTILDLGLSVHLGSPLINSTQMFAPPELYDRKYTAKESFDVYQLGMMMFSVLSFFSEQNGGSCEDVQEYLKEHISLEHLKTYERDAILFMRMSMNERKSRRKSLSDLLETDFIKRAGDSSDELGKKVMEIEGKCKAQ